MKYKLVLLGDTSVGKTGIVTRLTRDEFYNFQEPTIGSAFTTQTIQTEDKTVIFDIWDTAGQERYKSLVQIYYRNATVAVIVYDITNKDSFHGAKCWIRELKTKGPHDIIIALVGNKLDLQRTVAFEEVKIYTEEEQILYFETSAKKNINVTQMFVELAKQIPFVEQDIEFRDESLRMEQTKSIFGSCCYSSSMI